MSKDAAGITMKTTVTVRKFDHTLEDHPTEPYEVTVHESTSEVSEADAALMGFISLADRQALAETEQQMNKEAAPVHRIGVSDGGSINSEETS